MPEKIKSLYVKYRELIRYIIFGVLTTAVDYAVYTLLITLCHADDTFANAAAWFAAVIFAFITNKLFVFGSSSFAAHRLVFEFGTFLAARALTGGVYIGGYWLIADVWGAGDFIVIDNDLSVGGLLTKAFLSVFNIVVNYIFSKLITFKRVKTDNGNGKNHTVDTDTNAETGTDRKE